MKIVFILLLSIVILTIIENASSRYLLVEVDQNERAAPDPVFSCNGKNCGETCKRPGEKDVGKCNDQGHCIPFPWTGLSCPSLGGQTRQCTSNGNRADSGSCTGELCCSGCSYCGDMEEPWEICMECLPEK